MAALVRCEVARVESVSWTFGGIPSMTSTPVSKRFVRNVGALVLLLSLSLCGRLNAQMCQGPFGGSGGTRFRDRVPPGSQVQQINIRSGIYVDSLQIDLGGYSLPKHGGDGGTPDAIVLQPGEILTGISGQHGAYVDVIYFTTNFRTYGPYGQRKPNLTPFYYRVGPGQRIVGFCGGSGIYVDAIGVMVY